MAVPSNSQIDRMMGGAISQAQARIEQERKGRIQAVHDEYGKMIDKAREEQRVVGGRIDTQMGAMKQKEEELRAALPGQLETHGKAVDARLNELLAETGIQADIGRSQAGAAMAGRGLLRSTAGAEAIGEVSLQEQEQRQRAMMNAEQIKQQRKFQAESAIEGIKEKREGIALQRDLARESQLSQQIYTMEIAQQEATYNAQIQEMQLDEFQKQRARAKNKAIMGGLGAIFGTAAGAVIGGPQGAMIGGQAGSTAGGMAAG